MTPTDPGRPGEERGDRSDGNRPSARGRRGRGIVAATFLAARAIVLAVLLLVPRCGREVQDHSGSAAPHSQVVDTGRPTASWTTPVMRWLSE